MRSPSRLHRPAATALAAAAFLAGCAHRVALDSDPPGATVHRGEAVIGVTPTEVRLRWWPGRRLPVEVASPGYRSAAIRLDEDVGILRVAGEVLTLRWRRLLGLRPRAVHRLVLVPEHGPAGTWTPEDATGGG